MHDRVAGATTRVNVATGGTQASGVSYTSGDQRDVCYIAFGRPTNKRFTTRQTDPATEDQRGGAHGIAGGLTFLARAAGDLVAGDTNGKRDVLRA